MSNLNCTFNCCSGRRKCTLLWSWLLVVTLLGVSSQASKQPLVWPLPASFICDSSGSCPILAADLVVTVVCAPTSAVVESAVARYTALLRSTSRLEGAGAGQQAAVRSGGVSVLKAISIVVEDSNETLGINTNYSYSITLGSFSNTLHIRVASPFGVAYALETVWQLVPGGQLQCSSLSLADAPQYNHRGLMIDTGRRFYPVSFVESLLESMVQYKMSVLHFHFSEECFRIQSLIYPELGHPCVIGAHNNSEVYNQDEIAHLVEFARLRGVRIIPEMEMPGHSSGLCSTLASRGLVCCGDWQIFDDAAGSSIRVMSALLTEIAGLFPDNVFHLGGDELSSVSPCNVSNVKSFESKMMAHVQSLGKRPMGWEDMLTGRHEYTVPDHTRGWQGAAADFPSFIVSSWWRPEWMEEAYTGYSTVIHSYPIGAAGGSLYLDFSDPVGSVWMDITSGSSNRSALTNLLGAETSMWMDKYEYTCLFDSLNNDAFIATASAAIFPRAAIAAGSFWRWDSNLTVGSAEFDSVIDVVKSRLSQRSISYCTCANATHNGCSAEEVCGKPTCAPTLGPPLPARFRQSVAKLLVGPLDAYVEGLEWALSDAKLWV